MNLKCGLIGYGYWGPNLARALVATEGLSLKIVTDLDPSRLAEAKKLYKDIRVTDNFEVVCSDPDVDLIIIATPVSTHYKIAKRALQNGKHVLIEKPTTEEKSQTDELCYLAEKSRLTIATNFTFIFTGAITEIKKLLDSNFIGNVFHYDSSRINLGLLRSDTDVLGDLAVHDLAICSYLFDVDEPSVSGIAHSVINKDKSEIAQLGLRFGNGLFCSINVSWLSPVKLRKILIAGSKKMLVYDDMEPTEKLKIYDHGIDLIPGKMNYMTEEMRVSYRKGDIYIPRINETEALKNQFVILRDAIKSGTQPIHGSKLMKKVMAALELCRAQCEYRKSATI